MFVVGKEEEIATMEGGFHWATQNNDDRRFRARDNHQALPDHEGGRNDHAETERLKDNIKIC